MTTVTLTSADRNNTIATDGTLTAIRLIDVPTQYRSLFSLVDDSVSTGVPRQLFHIDVSTSYASSGHAFLTNGNILFGNLTVRDIPEGSKFEIDYRLS